MGIYGIWVDVYRYQRKIAEERAPENSSSSEVPTTKSGN